jgi:hypothetical protein
MPSTSTVHRPCSPWTATSGDLHQTLTDREHTSAGSPSSASGLSPFTIAYTLMRPPLVVQWLRAALDDPGHRRFAQGYAIGRLAAQHCGWRAFWSRNQHAWPCGPPPWPLSWVPPYWPSGPRPAGCAPRPHRRVVRAVHDQRPRRAHPRGQPGHPRLRGRRLARRSCRGHPGTAGPGPGRVTAGPAVCRLEGVQLAAR